MASNTVTPLREREVGAWQHEADVVVCGYGVAGAAAAVEAAAHGADVLVLERTGGGGGAAAMAGGFIYLGGGTPIQKACGFEDTAENMAAFLNAALGPGADEAKIAAYSEGSVDHYQWLVECGVPFAETFWGEPGWEPPDGYCLMYSGGENAAPFNEIATPAPRGHVPLMTGKKTGERGGGYMLMQPLIERAGSLGVRVEYDARAQRLVVDDDGRVVGVVARRHGEDFLIRARRGVVLAMGSFVFNPEMVRNHAPLLMGRPGAAIDTHDGRAIRMAQALGAGIEHMGAAEVALACDPQLMARGILVNRRGQRFITEDTYPGRMGQEALFHQENRVYLVIDEEAYDEGAAAPTATPYLRLRPTWVAESVAELEEDMGLPEGALQSTVAVYNQHAATRTDPVLGKKSEWVKPIGSPVAAIDLSGRTGGFTLGGLRTTVDSEVVHIDEEPIPGLYAAGRCTAGLSSWGYASGISLGDGSFFGRRAGRSAARG